MGQELLDTGWTIILIVAMLGSAFIVGIGVAGLMLMVAILNTKLRRKF